MVDARTPVCHLVGAKSHTASPRSDTVGILRLAASGSGEVVRVRPRVSTISIRACLAKQRVAFATATEWGPEAKHQNTLTAEPRRLRFVRVLVVGEVAYILLDPGAATATA